MTTIQKNQTMRGIIYAMTAFFLFTVMNLFAKLLAENGHHVISIAFWRNALSIVPFFLYIAITQQYNLLKTSKPGVLTVRVIIGVTGLVITLAAIERLPMADATMIFLSATLITPALAFFVLKEHIGPHRWGAIILGMVGVIMILEPTGHGTLLGISFAFLAAFSHSLVHIFLRFLKNENSLTLAFYFLLGGAVFTAPFMPFVGKIPDNMNDIALLIGVGATGSIAQILLAMALKHAPASTVSPFGFTGLLWATIFDIAIWSYIPGWPVFIGATMIIAANAYIVHRERINVEK